MHISDPASLRNLVLPYHQAVVANDYEPIRTLFMEGAKVLVSDLNETTNEYDIDHLGHMSKKFVDAIDHISITLETLRFYPVAPTLGSFAAGYRMDGTLKAHQQTLMLRFEDAVDFDKAGLMSRVKRTVKIRPSTPS